MAAKIIKHGKPKTPKELLGFPEKDPGAFIELREKVYKEFFGKPEYVSHELVPLVPNIDVWIYPPQPGRDFYTLVSSGMSDLPMNLEANVPRSFARREVILYTAVPDNVFIELVRNIARFPFQYSSWLGAGHTIPNGTPPAPLFANSILMAVILLKTGFDPNRNLSKQVVLDSDPVDFLWLVPLTKQELDFKLSKGLDALLGVMEKASLSHILDPERDSLV